MPHLRCDAAAGLASIALASGDTQRALRHAGEVLRYLREQALAGCGEPAWSVLTCMDVFNAAGDARASEILRLGALLIERRAGALPEPLRGRYLDAFPARRAVLQRWSEQLADELRASPVVRVTAAAPAVREAYQASDAPAAPD